MISVGFSQLFDLIKGALPPKRTFYIIIDGLDECEKSDRLDFLKSLSSSLPSFTSSVKVCITSRGTAPPFISNASHRLDTISMSCPLAKADIQGYVEFSIQESMDDERLLVGDPTLVEDIKAALNTHSDGM